METPHAGRFFSLDVFRGFTIASMILVDSPELYSEVYPQLKHAEWNGWTFTDTIFPCFLFIMGVSMVFSFARRKENGPTDSLLSLQIVKRTIILFGLGLFINGYPNFDLSVLRIPGVLQRIALCYFFSSMIVRKCGPKGQVYWLSGLLVSYWAMMRFIPVPGIGAGVLEPGHNFVAYVDSLFLKGHMYGTWDPEGLVSTIPAIGTTLFGALVGNWLHSPASGRKKAVVMACAGVVLVMAGMILDRWFPINKGIWTSTFCIFMAGIAMLTLALFYWLIDIKDYRRWCKVFIVFGMNPIAIYVMSEIVDPMIRGVLRYDIKLISPLMIHLLSGFLSPLAVDENISLVFALSYVGLMYLIAWSMWKMKIFIKI